jgi:hypothetical protein
LPQRQLRRSDGGRDVQRAARILMPRHRLREERGPALPPLRRSGAVTLIKMPCCA